jgi:hypothetical protein
MPQNGAYENHNLMDEDGQASVLFLLQGGVANLIHFMAGRVNELWNVVCLAPLTFFLEPTPTQGGNHISSTVH